jgi:hypothetical protein
MTTDFRLFRRHLETERDKFLGKLKTTALAAERREHG